MRKSVSGQLDLTGKNAALPAGWAQLQSRPQPAAGALGAINANQGEAQSASPLIINDR